MSVGVMDPKPLSSNGNEKQQTVNKSPKKSSNCLQKVGSCLAGGLESLYYNLGVAIGKRPIVTIVCVLLACLACGAGLAKFYQIDASDPIWVDPKSTYLAHKAWVDEKFPSQTRLSVFIAEGDNMLTPDAILELYDLHYQMTNISGDGYDYEKICTRLGQGDTAKCWSTSILELWDFDRAVILNLTVKSLLHDVNNVTKSPVTNAAFDVKDYLGGLSMDGSGRIVGAQAAIFTYFMQGTNSSNAEFVSEDEVTALTEEWELEFIEIAKEYSGKLISKINAFSTRSFGDEIGSSIFGDVYKLSAGYVIITVYVALILGRFNCVEMRVYLALGAVLAVGLSICVSFGLSSAFGIGYGPVQSILPFLLLGLGVDDAFVIVQAWNRLTAAERTLPLHEQSGHALKHAGVSITVTSITDIVAFGIGATTALPALRDFCIYAAIGIIALFIVQATFFSACVVLDERRRTVRRNGCCCCYSHKDDYEPNECSRRDLQQSFFEKFYGPFIVKLPVKIVVVVVSLGLLALAIYGVVNLKQEYDPNDFIPKDSYVREYIDSFEEYFPDKGVDSGFVYLHDLSYYKEYDKINRMVGEFKGESSVDSDSVDSWLEGYMDWLGETKCPWIKSHINSTTKWPLDERRFNMLLTPYIYMTSVGRRHIRNAKFNETVTFGDQNDTGTFDLSSVISGNSVSNPNLTTAEILELEEDFSSRHLVATRIPFDFADLAGSAERVEAMDDTRQIIANYYTDDNSFPFSRSFETWETDKIIQKELYRNVGLAFGCVIILTLFLIADIITCLLVSVCVLSTLVEVGGFMFFWGLSIDTVTCIQLVLAIGLAVDYSAHIGHTFMTVVGTRRERAMKTIADIGPAVFNGGFSTLLAFMLLVSSNSYVFDVFFRINLLVVLLGLWNGMVLLPVMLSVIGPSPYLSAQLSTVHDSAIRLSRSAADNLALEVEQPDVKVKTSSADPEQGVATVDAVPLGETEKASDTPNSLPNGNHQNGEVLNKEKLEDSTN